MMSRNEQGRVRQGGGYGGCLGERRWDSAQDGRSHRGHLREGRQGGPGVENFKMGLRED